MQTKRKVFAYITQGNDLLVFEHEDAPEAGIQVPAGTLEDGETPEEGVLREAKEETGLQKLSIVRFLGEQIRDMSDYGKSEIHHRYFYHLISEDDTHPLWRHYEHYSSDNSGKPYLFWFHWSDINQLPELIADHDFYVKKLRGLLRSYKAEE